MKSVEAEEGNTGEQPARNNQRLAKNVKIEGTSKQSSFDIFFILMPPKTYLKIFASALIAFIKLIFAYKSILFSDF